MARLYKPSKKTRAYIKSMISKKVWKVNEKIPSALAIADAVSVSQITVRKVIRILEKKGILECYGSLGTFVKYAGNNKNLIRNLKSTVRAADLIGEGGIQIGRFIIRYIPAKKEIISLDIIVGEEVVTSMKAINDYLRHPLSLKSINRKKSPKKALEEWKNQKKIALLARTVARHKKELGINGK